MIIASFILLCIVTLCSIATASAAITLRDHIVRRR